MSHTMHPPRYRSRLSCVLVRRLLPSVLSWPMIDDHRVVLASPETRRTYRAVLSEPRIVIPSAIPPDAPSQPEMTHSGPSATAEAPVPPADSEVSVALPSSQPPSAHIPASAGDQQIQSNGRKRPLEDGKEDGAQSEVQSGTAGADEGKDTSARKRKKKKMKESKA